MTKGGIKEPMGKVKSHNSGGFDNPISKTFVALFLKDPSAHAAIYQCLAVGCASYFLVTYKSFLPIYFGSALFWVCSVALFALWAACLYVIRNGLHLTKNRLRWKNLNGRTIVVTGGASGIGKCASLHFLRCGANVIVGCRTPSKGKELLQQAQPLLTHAKQTVQVLALDLERLASVREFAKAVLAKNVPVDTLINNAGVMNYPTLKRTEAGVELQSATNHLGHFLLTLLLLDNIKGCNGRIVNVASIAHGFAPGASVSELDNVSPETYNSVRFYGISKLCNIWFTKELQRRLTQSSSGATAYAVHPGSVKSELHRHMAIFTANRISAAFYWLVSFILKSTSVGAYTQIFVALAPRSELVSGAYYADCKIGSVIADANDKEKAKDLWAWSEKNLHL